MENPFPITRPDIVGADMPGRAGAGTVFEHTTQYQQVLVNDSGCGGRYEQQGRHVAIQLRSDIDSAIAAEFFDWLTGHCIQRVEMGAGNVKDALIVSVFPVTDTPIDALGFFTVKGVELPLFFTGFRIDRDYFQGSGSQVHDPIDNNWITFDGCIVTLGDVAGSIYPRHFQLPDVAGIYLVQRRIFGAGGISAIYLPIPVAVGAF